MALSQDTAKQSNRGRHVGLVWEGVPGQECRALALSSLSPLLGITPPASWHLPCVGCSATHLAGSQSSGLPPSPMGQCGLPSTALRKQEGSPSAALQATTSSTSVLQRPSHTCCHVPSMSPRGCSGPGSQTWAVPTKRSFQQGLPSWAGALCHQAPTLQPPPPVFLFLPLSLLLQAAPAPLSQPVIGR